MKHIKIISFLLTSLMFFGCEKEPEISCCFDPGSIITFDFNQTVGFQHAGDTIGKWYSTYTNSTDKLNLYSNDINYTNIVEGEGYIILKKDLNGGFINLGTVTYYDVCTDDYDERKLGIKEYESQRKGLCLTSVKADTTFEQPDCISYATPMHKNTSYVTLTFYSEFDWEVKELVNKSTIFPSFGKAGENQTITLTTKNNSENNSPAIYRIWFNEQDNESNYSTYQLVQAGKSN